MKRKRILLILAILSLATSCVKDNLNTGNKLNGYWYLSSYQRVLKSSSGAVLQSIDMPFTENDSPRYMNVSGDRFVPYIEQDNKHGWSGWEHLNFTPGYLLTFSLTVEADNSNFMPPEYSFKFFSDHDIQVDSIMVRNHMPYTYMALVLSDLPAAEARAYIAG